MSHHETQTPPPDPRSGRAPSSGSRSQASPRDPGNPVDGVEGPPTVLRGSSVDSKRSPSGFRPTPAIGLPRPGDVLGTFVVEEAIGAGGMGAVFRAHDAVLDREVALKLLPPDQVDDPEVVQRFYQEGKSAASLDHENIARVYSLGQDGPYHFIVFEYVAGETVRRRVDERGPMPVAEAVDVTLQITQALVHASLRGVVHRDVKPSNIILTPEGRAKLVDMGLARRFERQSERGGLTQTGMTLGTFDYISPEQARDPRDVDVRSDLYSLGCTLFHMLTGQPPFPGGTVLQKLLQHQEEPPPDVRDLNPGVPQPLVKVLDKLMAKDRDRRCQSPEQLVRDLLSVAGRAGLALPHYETGVAGNVERPAWERPLAALTLAGFLMLAAGLFFWGRDLIDPPAASPAVEYPPLRASRSPAVSPPAPGPAAVVPGATTAPGPQPRKIDVRPDEDLTAVLASAPHKSVITLTGDGPYLVVGRPPSSRGDQPPRDVAIRAEPGKRPVLRFAADSRTPASALIAFVRGRLSVEGLTFEAEGRALDDRVASILLEDAELRLKGCTFRRPGEPAGGPGLVAVRSRVTRPDPAAGDRPPPIVADQCHFDPGAAAINCEGAADVQLHDCTFGPGGTAVALDDEGDVAAPTRDVLIVRSSFMAGAAPVFRVRGPQARFQVDDCVLAPIEDSTAPGPRILALVDDPRDLTWAGRSNLFGRFGVLLDVAGKPNSDEAVRDFDHWRADLREVRSTLATTPVWESPDPARELALNREAPSRAFRLASAAGVGARKGPFGTVVAAAAPPRPAFSAPIATADPRAAEPGPPIATPPYEPTTSDDMVARADPSEPMTMPPMETAEPTDDENFDEPTPRNLAPPGTSRKSGSPVVGIPQDPARRPFEVAPATGPPLVAAPDVAEPARSAPAREESTVPEEDVIRSAEQLRTLIAHHAATGGGELRLGAGVDLEFATLDLPSGSWSIAAEPGDHGARPRLRFHPSPFGSPSTWNSLFNLQSGSLKLRGVDVIVQDFDRQSMGRLATFVVAAGSSADLTDCTISLVGQAASLAVAAVVPRRGGGAAVAATPPRPAVVRIRDCFLRTSGDAIAVASNQRLDCRLDNVVVAADGSVLHAQGGTDPTRDDPSLTLRLDRVMARAKGGLIRLEGSIDETELPLAQVDARDSVLSTGADGSAPLFRVDDRGRARDLADRIRWTGENVGYHEIAVYRVDDAGQTGVPPQRYSRSDWLNNFVARDDAAVVDVDFIDHRAPSLPARSLSPEALRLSPRSPLARKGPDFTAVPSPPDADS